MVDIIFLLFLVGGLALGFFQGTLKLLIAIIAFYVGIILASLYFQSVGNFFRTRFGSTLEIGQIMAFGVILLVAFLVLTIAGLYTFRYAKVPPSLDFLDRIIGTLFGLMMGALFLGMLAVLLRLLFDRPIGDLSSLPIMASFQGSVQQSYLVDFFADRLLPLIYGAIRPVLPQEAELIFKVR